MGQEEQGSTTIYWKSRSKEIANLHETNVFKSIKLLSLRAKCPKMEFFLVSIQSEHRTIRTRKNSVFGPFLLEKQSNTF